MGMMTRMRNLAPWFILTVGVLFVLFMVMSDANITEVFRNQSRIIGSIDGKEIYYQDFVKRVEFEKDNLERQGRPILESQMSDFRDQVWDSMVNEILVDKKIQEFGIEVTDQEVVDNLLGANPPQFVQQYFLDSTGTFNRQAYDMAIRNPENKDAVLQLEDMVRRQLTQQKLTDYLFSAVQVSESEIVDDFVKQNVFMNAEYVSVPTNIIADSVVNLTEEYQKSYYEENIQNYQQDEKRVIDYVLFNTKASKEDTSNIISNLGAIVEKAKKDTLPFKTYVEIYSEKEYSLDTLSITKIDANLQSLISNAKKGDLIGPTITREGAVVVKLINTVKAKESAVRASHILIKGDSKESQKKANDIYKQLRKGADFAKLAKENSEDPGSAVKGGDLGWFGKGQMVKEFEKASFSGRVGRVQKPVKTQFGYHIIKVVAKANNDYVIEKIVNELKASATTVDYVYNKASDFSYVAKKGSYDTELELMKLTSVESRPFTKTQKSISGLGSNFSIVNFAFNNPVGEVSDVFRIQNGYVVFRVAKEIKGGATPYTEAANAVKTQALNELKLNKAIEIANQVRTKIGTSGNLELAKEVEPKAKVAKVNNFKLGVNIPTIGREFSFSEYSYMGEVGKVSQPVKGNRAAYLIKVLSRTPFDSTGFSVQRASIYEKLMRTKQRDFLNSWVDGIKEEADIVDNRYNFFR